MPLFSGKSHPNRGQGVQPERPTHWIWLLGCTLLMQHLASNPTSLSFNFPDSKKRIIPQRVVTRIKRMVTMFSTALGTWSCLFKLHHFFSLSLHHWIHASDTSKSPLRHSIWKSINAMVYSFLNYTSWATHWKLPMWVMLTHTCIYIHTYRHTHAHMHSHTP